MLFPDKKNAHIWVDEDRDSPLAREQGDELRAGFFLLQGRVHIVARTSHAERRLLDRGAIHFADVTFELSVHRN